MMNLFQLQEQLKDFSKDQLLSEMQSPSGSAPPFLVMTELQRRTRMENAAALDKGPPTSTVAQDTVNAAGVPQGGIADMARSLAPQTDMTQNTGMMTPQAGVATQGAAPVQTMQEGGLTSRVGRPLYANPDGSYYSEKTVTFPFDGKWLTFPSVDESGNVLSEDEVFDYVQKNGPVDPITGETFPLFDTVEDAETYARDRSKGLINFRNGGLAGISRNVSDYYSGAARDMAMDRRMGSDAQYTPPERDLTEFYAAKAIEGRATPEDLTLLDRQARSAGMETDAFIQAILNGDPEAPPELGPQTMDQMIEGPMAGRALGVGPVEFNVPDRLLQGQRGAGASDFTPRPETPAGITGIADAAARVRAAERAAEIGARRGPPEQAAPERGDVIDVSDGMSAAPLDQFLSSLPMGDLTEGLRPRTERVADMAMDRRMGGDQPQVPPADPNYGYIDPRVGYQGPRPAFIDRAIEALTSGPPTIAGYEYPENYGTAEPPEMATLVPAEDLGTMTPEELLPAPPAPEVLTPQAPTGPAGSTTSGATVGGMPVPPPQTNEDRMLQQDKWLALARFGAALASSRAPTFGQAVGEAGQVGLDALSQARQDFLGRKEAADKMALARATLAARTAGRGGAAAEAAPRFGLSAAQARALDPLNDDISRLEQALLNAEDDAAASEPWFGSPDENLVGAANTIRDKLATLKLQRDNIVRFGAGLPATGGVVAGGGNVGYDVSD
jgi:hypothetical protein